MTTPRITLPTILGGDWDSALICTYGADLAFFEQDLWRQIERTRNRIILADGHQIHRYLHRHSSLRLRHVNRSYVLAPVSVEHAAHAKLIMLLREDAGLLAIGSGNLSFDGYASQGECFTIYRWSPDQSASHDAFTTAREFIDELAARELVDSIVRARIAQAWQDAPWLFGAGSGAEGVVRHNLDIPLLDQLVDAIGRERVDELTVHAPFYDHRCDALKELLSRTLPKRVRILLQERLTSVDPKQLARVISGSPAKVDVRSVQAPEKGTFLHAKFIIARLKDRAVCLQGSPNLSSPALLKAHPAGNLELANLLEGPVDAFDHLVASLEMSSEAVDVGSLGLRLLPDNEDDDEELAPELVRELAWTPPRLTGVFDLPLAAAPTLAIAGQSVDDVEWKLEATADGSTRFIATLGEHGRLLLDRVEAIRFTFEDGTTSAAAYPYHLNALVALASGQGRADLLREAGDFDLDDEELEALLAQLDEVLLVDGRSVWRMLRRKAPEATDDAEAPRLAYEDLDWKAIQSHPKLAQYRNWAQHSGTDPTGLGILLSSIAERFRLEVARRTGQPISQDKSQSAGGEVALDDLSVSVEPEDELEVEDAAIDREKRRQSARARARRLFRSFVRRFVDGITDSEFVRLVGPSVILPSYVVFNHICWKLARLDLAERTAIVESQVALWRFFWGDDAEPGYLASLSEPEQEAALDLLDRHHAEAVLLTSVLQAYDITWHEADDRLPELRDLWRGIVTHDLWQPTKEALADAAAVAGNGSAPMPATELLDELEGLAHYYTENEPRYAIANEVGADPASITETEGRVRRGDLGEQTVEIYLIEDAGAQLTPLSAGAALSALAKLRPDATYLRLAHPSSNTVAFADFDAEDYLWANQATGDLEDLELPPLQDTQWERALEDLRSLAA